MRILHGITWNITRDIHESLLKCYNAVGESGAPNDPQVHPCSQVHPVIESALNDPHINSVVISAPSDPHVHQMTYKYTK